MRRSPHFRIARKAPISGAGDLISTTTESSMASNPWRTPLGCRQTSPGPMINSSEPTVDFTLPSPRRPLGTGTFVSDRRNDLWGAEGDPELIQSQVENANYQVPSV